MSSTCSNPSLAFSSFFFSDTSEFAASTVYSWPPSSKPQTQRKAPRAHAIMMRELVRGFAGASTTPPECIRIASSWRKFNATEDTSLSSEELRASVLWTPTGTTPDYNPPLAEYFNMKCEVAPKPLHGAVRNPNIREIYHRRHPSSRGSWSTEASSVSSADVTEPLTFGRQAIKSVRTKSMLSESLKQGAKEEGKRRESPVGALARALGKQIAVDELPSAFDSDSEDDEY